VVSTAQTLRLLQKQRQDVTQDRADGKRAESGKIKVQNLLFKLFTYDLLV
jgi:hypothetical protein